MGLTNGSLRPLAPINLAGAFFSGTLTVAAVAVDAAVTAGALATITACLVAGFAATAPFFTLARVVAGTVFTPGFAADANDAGATPPLLFAGNVPVATGGLAVATTPGLLAAPPLGVVEAVDEDFAAVVGLTWPFGAVGLAGFALGPFLLCALAWAAWVWALATDVLFAAEVDPALAVPDPCVPPLFAAEVEADAGLAVLAAAAGDFVAVAAGVLESDFFAADTDGLGDGLALAAVVPPLFCPAAIAVMAVASARI